MLILVTVIHVLVCLILIGVVLLQSGKAADLAGAFGGMGSQTTFGPRAAATVLSKVTTAAAGLFMVTSLTLAVMATKGGGKAAGGSVLDRTNVAPPAQIQLEKPSKGPAVELVDEQGNVKKKFEVELPKEGAKDANGNPIPVKIGKEIPVNSKGNSLPQKAPETKAPEKK
ncbi:MAG: preprotein translocase subunit SecG [Bryobacter sp.]|jgi:preprotein translocase subunit SecG|nr:preprotein translocase subunit SecG [Bryobacter sp. CoA8 C33]